MMEAMTAAPVLDWTALLKIVMKGKGLPSSRTCSMLPMRKSTVRSIAKPRVPLIEMPVMMERGTMICAF